LVGLLKERHGTIEKFNAAGGSALVMEPRTGKILAMASQPTFNPNEYTKYVDERVYFRNKPIWYMYEPGSTMKPITVASAVDAGVVEPFEKSIMCEHAIQVNGWTIRDEHGDLPGLKSPLDIIVNSFNTGAARIAMKMGSQTLQSYFARFNFGRYYDFPLNGQSRGILPDYKEAREVTIANNGFGHGISVTQLQMAMAIAAIANGGLIMKPTIVEKIVDPITQTPIQEFEPKVVRRAVKEETSRVVRYMMHMVTEQGTGEKAKIPGYRVAGKTGTAQVAGNHGYMAGQYISSFVGFAPAEDPQVLVMVTIEKPRGSYYAAEVAAPAFKEIMKKTLWHLEIPPSPPEKEPLGY
ncbi:MAG TPA: penicillin-binding protein 2, partial [bacterium]|nr:penicillin-binding protein 2 [bacterium]